MKYYRQAEVAARQIVEAFEKGNVPQALGLIFLNFETAEKPRDKWSWSNQFLAALLGNGDARGFRQWQDAGRHVKKGEKAFPILVPIFKKLKVENKTTGKKEEREVLVGFTSAPVFGIQQTDGADLPGDKDRAKFIDALPLVEVARAWKLDVECFNAVGGRLGGYYHGVKIDVGAQNLLVWAHELVHAADDRNGELMRDDQKWRREAIAELGGAVLLELIGLGQHADRGGAWKYIKAYCEAEGKDPVRSCMSVINRTCKAVALILEEAEKAKGQSVAA